MNKKITIIIDSDIIFRNFIFNKAFKDIEKVNDIHYIFPEKGNKRLLIDVESYIDQKKIYRIKEDTKRKLFWRYLLFLDQFKFSFDKDLKVLKELRILSLGKKASFIFNILSLPILRQILIKLITYFLKKKKYIDLENYCKKEKPDLLIHPTVLDGIFCNDLILMGRKYLIKTIFIMNSWDNPSSKSCMVGNPDHLLVWGPQTKRHAMKYLKMEDKKIIEFGANQFCEIRKIQIKNNLQSFNKKKNKILFAGSNAQVNEYECLNQLNNLMFKNKSSFNVIYKPHPWAGGGVDGYKFKKKIWKKIKINNSQTQYLNKVSKNFVPMSLPKQIETYDMIKEVNITVSPLSTIILETILSGRLAILYIPEDINNNYINKIMKKMIHFKELLKSGDVPIAKNPKILFEQLNFYSEYFNYKLCLDKQQNLIPDILKTHKDEWPKRFQNLIQSLL